MDIGATYKGKGKGKSKGKGFNKGGHKGKGYQQGKGYGGYGSYSKGKGKGKQQQWYQPKGVEKGNKGKSKGAHNKGKGKNPTAICYRCGQQGHLAKDCRTAVYNMAETPQEQNQDVTSQWYDPNSGYDNYWYSNDQSGNYNTQPSQQQQLKTKGAEAPCTALLGWFYGGFLKWSPTGDIFSHGVTFY